MEITEVRIKLMEGSEDRLRAFCSVTLDHCFVVRDLKIIDGANGPFVAMPSRKLTSHCYRCGYKNHLRAIYCNQCGSKFRRDQGGEYDSPQKLYADVAHPINSECREMIQEAVIEELHAELSRAGQPGYRSRYDDDFEESQVTHPEAADSEAKQTVSEPETPAKRSPPKPHFPQRTRKQSRESSSEQRSERAQEDDDQDAFGAGIL